MLYRFTSYWKILFSILFSNKKKIFVLCYPIHSNLGDQAQLMCTDAWIAENYPEYRNIHLGAFTSTLNFPPYRKLLFSLISSFLLILVLKIKVKTSDIFLGHSGYLMVDHHSGWKMFTDIMYYFPRNKMIIFPQTVNFYTPVIKQIVSQRWNNHKDLTLLCRDEVSFSNARDMLPNMKLFLFPDIVTSLIGTRQYSSDRDGVLFCMRNDIEAFYKVDAVNKLMSKFPNIRTEKIDTTINIDRKTMEKNRESIINKMIEKIATFKVVITDRYHGTIFSAIASTPVIVISSADHKLSSGVKWFPRQEFGGNIQFASTLEEAYKLAIDVLNRKDSNYNNPPYFLKKYWNQLREELK